MQFDFEKHPLCYTSKFGGTIAVNPMLEGEEDFVSWFDPTHNRMFDLAEVEKDTPDKLVWRDRRGRKHFLEPLTADVYKKHVKPLIPTAPDLKTDREVREFYLK